MVPVLGGDNTLTASDRRILLAKWYKKAVTKALQGDAKRQYFQHAGALLTADGSDVRRRT